MPPVFTFGVGRLDFSGVGTTTGLGMVVVHFRQYCLLTSFMMTTHDGKDGACIEVAETIPSSLLMLCHPFHEHRMARGDGEVLARVIMTYCQNTSTQHPAVLFSVRHFPHLAELDCAIVSSSQP